MRDHATISVQTLYGTYHTAVDVWSGKPIVHGEWLFRGVMWVCLARW